MFKTRIYRARQASKWNIALKLFKHEISSQRIYAERNAMMRIQSPYKEFTISVASGGKEVVRRICCEEEQISLPENTSYLTFECQKQKPFEQFEAAEIHQKNDTVPPPVAAKVSDVLNGEAAIFPSREGPILLT